MKLDLNYKIEVEVRESNKVKDKLTVYLREYSQEELRENKDLKKQFSLIVKKIQKIAKKQSSLEKKASLYELNGDYSKAISTLDKRDKLENELESLSKELEDIGGHDQEAFAEELAKKRFYALVSGDDFAKLDEIAQIKGYQTVIQQLDIAKRDIEKKQYGE